MTRPMKKEKSIHGKRVQKRVNIQCLTAYPLKGLLTRLALGLCLGTWVSGTFPPFPELIRVAHCA